MTTQEMDVDGDGSVRLIHLECRVQFNRDPPQLTLFLSLALCAQGGSEEGKCEFVEQLLDVQCMGAQRIEVLASAIPRSLTLR